MTKPLKIEELFAWVSVDRDGDEGVMAICGQDGVWFPLIGADKDRIESHRKQALGLASAIGVEVRLLKFSTMEVLETVHPKPKVTN